MVGWWLGFVVLNRHRHASCAPCCAPRNDGSSVRRQGAHPITHLPPTVQAPERPTNPECVDAGEDSLPSWFQCTCQGDHPVGCVCPSLAPPGGLAPANTPLFILFSHDDAITPEAHSGLQTIYEHGRSLDAAACGAVATLFTLERGTSACNVPLLVWCTQCCLHSPQPA